MQIIALNLNTAIDTFIEPRFTDFLRLCVSFQCRWIKWSTNAKETERKFQSFSEFFFSLFSSLLKWQLSRRKKFEYIGYWITCALQTSICLPTYFILCIYACKNYCKICMYMCFVSIHIWFRSLHIFYIVNQLLNRQKKQRLTRLNEMQCTIGQISFAGIQKCFFSLWQRQQQATSGTPYNNRIKWASIQAFSYRIHSKHTKSRSIKTTTTTKSS